MINTQVLPEADQFKIAMHLHSEGMLGVHEDPEDFITLKSGRLSPHYLNIRPGVSDAPTRSLIARGMLGLARISEVPEFNEQNGIQFEHIVGTPEACTSYAATMADISHVNLLQPRVAKKLSGNKTPILGRYNEGDRAALFDDVVTDGQTKIEAITGLGSSGLIIAGYFVVMNRQEGGVPQAAEETDVSIQLALTVSSVVRMLRDEGIYSVAQFDNVKQYLEQYGDPGVATSMGSA